MKTIVIALSNANMGDMADEKDFNLWIRYVTETIGEATKIRGIEVSQHKGAEDVISGADDDERETLRRWLSVDGWEAFCAGPWQTMAAEASHKPHGYETDIGALRAIVSLYSEATIEADGVYFATAHDTPEHWTTLDRVSDLGTARNELSRIWATLGAASVYPSFTLASQLATMPGHTSIGRTAEWLGRVRDDVLARLAGEMAKALPESPAHVEAKPKADDHYGAAR